MHLAFRANDCHFSYLYGTYVYVLYTNNVEAMQAIHLTCCVFNFDFQPSKCAGHFPFQRVDDVDGLL